MNIRERESSRFRASLRGVFTPGYGWGGSSGCGFGHGYGESCDQGSGFGDGYNRGHCPGMNMEFGVDYKVDSLYKGSYGN